MSKKEEIDIDEEVERLARKTNINIKKSEFSFSKRLERLDNDINQISKEKIKDFEENKKLTQDYLSIEYSHDTIDRYREKLKKI